MRLVSKPSDSKKVTLRLDRYRYGVFCKNADGVWWLKQLYEPKDYGTALSMAKRLKGFLKDFWGTHPAA